MRLDYFPHKVGSPTDSIIRILMINDYAGLGGTTHPFVHYYDEHTDSANVWFSMMQGTHNIAFWKRKTYSYQQEFRILISGKGLSEDHIELEIGDISDISLIQSTSKVLSSILEKVK